MTDVVEQGAARDPAWFARVWPALASAALVSVCLFVFGLLTDQLALRLLSKPWPVVALMALVAARRGDDPALKAFWGGLAACLVGDMLLEFRTPQTFLPGMVAFLVGHLGYIAATLRRERGPALELALPFAAWVGWAIWTTWGGLGAMRVPVVIYTLVIFTMMWRAAAMWSTRRTLGAALVLLGAVSFGFSDTLIALDRFHKPIPGARVPIIVTYWLGQALMTAGWLRTRAQRLYSEAVEQGRGPDA